MNEVVKLGQQAALVKVISRAIDYAEALSALSNEALDKHKAKDASQYLFAAMIMKDFAEELQGEFENEQM